MSAASEFEIALETTPAPEASELEDDDQRSRRETAIRLLQFLLAVGRDPESVGKRVALLAFVLGASPFRTQRQLAQWCRVSEARISAAIKVLRQRWAGNIDD